MTEPHLEKRLSVIPGAYVALRTVRGVYDTTTWELSIAIFPSDGRCRPGCAELDPHMFQGFVSTWESAIHKAVQLDSLDLASDYTVALSDLIQVERTSYGSYVCLSTESSTGRVWTVRLHPAEAEEALDELVKIPETAAAMVRTLDELHPPEPTAIVGEDVLPDPDAGYPRPAEDLPWFRRSRPCTTLAVIGILACTFGAPSICVICILPVWVAVITGDIYYPRFGFWEDLLLDCTGPRSPVETWGWGRRLGTWMLLALSVVLLLIR